MSHPPIALGLLVMLLSGALAAADPAPAEPPPDPEYAAYRARCLGCHLPERRLVGPPMGEIAPLYRGKLDELVAWLKKPGRRRQNYPPMPPVMAGDDEIRAAAAYLLRVAAP